MPVFELEAPIASRVVAVFGVYQSQGVICWWLAANQWLAQGKARVIESA